jgi:hypothetical protein
MLCDIEDVANHTPPLVGQSEEWVAITNSAENRKNYCKVLRCKTLFSALYGTYTVTSNERKSVLKDRHQGDGFKVVRSRKGRSSEEADRTLKKRTVPVPSVMVATRNFSAPSGHQTWILIPLPHSQMQ